MAPPRITIDTNCINARSSLPAMTRLEYLHSEGRVQIVKTDVLDTELSEWQGHRGERARRKPAQLHEDIGVWVLGHSRLGHTRLAGDDDVLLYEELEQEIFELPQKKLSRRQVRDVMIIATHLKHGRDYLVTLDRGLIDRASRLREKFGITVLTPDECLSLVEAKR